ncbi:MAG: DMT family transporter [Planctomyces sp.]|nr:DMT family transporter [Planctomyces sp.]
MNRLDDEECGDGVRRRAIAGVAFGLSSALAYTLTNVLLREVASRGDLGWTAWVTCLKALPSAIVAWGIILWQAGRGRRMLPDGRSLVALTAAGLLMQLGGNLIFQNALSLGGLALSVPLCFSTLILAGALGGRFLLGEVIPRRTLAAMALLILSVFVLQQGADAASQVMRPDRTGWTVIYAVVGACLSGICFGLGGVAIRHSVAGTGTVVGAIAPIAAAGVVFPVMIAVYRLGWEGLAAISLHDQLSMLGAGTFNAIGFFAVGAAMARLPLTRVNLINSSQAALCALAGIIWFGEPATVWIGLGTILTVASLAILGTQDRADVVVTADAEAEAELAIQPPPALEAAPPMPLPTVDPTVPAPLPALATTVAESAVNVQA